MTLVIWSQGCCTVTSSHILWPMKSWAVKIVTDWVLGAGKGLHLEHLPGLGSISSHQLGDNTGRKRGHNLTQQDCTGSPLVNLNSSIKWIFRTVRSFSSVIKECPVERTVRITTSRPMMVGFNCQLDIIYMLGKEFQWDCLDSSGLWTSLWGQIGFIKVRRCTLNVNNAISWAGPWTEKSMSWIMHACMHCSLLFKCDWLFQAPAAVTSLQQWTVTWNCELKINPPALNCCCQVIYHSNRKLW